MKLGRILAITLLLGICFAVMADQSTNLKTILSGLEKVKMSDSVRNELKLDILLNEIDNNPDLTIKRIKAIKDPELKDLTSLLVAGYFFREGTQRDWAKKYIDGNWRTIYQHLAVKQAQNESYASEFAANREILNQKALVAWAICWNDDYREACSIMQKVMAESYYCSNNMKRDFENEYGLLAILSQISVDDLDRELVSYSQNSPFASQTKEFLYFYKPGIELYAMAAQAGHPHFIVPDPEGLYPYYTFNDNNITCYLNYIKAAKKPELEFDKRLDKIRLELETQFKQLKKAEDIPTACQAAVAFTPLDPSLGKILAEQVKILSEQKNLCLQDQASFSFFIQYIKEVILKEKVPYTDVYQALYNLNEENTKEYLDMICDFIAKSDLRDIKNVDGDNSMEVDGIRYFAMEKGNDITKTRLLISLLTKNDNFSIIDDWYFELQVNPKIIDSDDLLQELVANSKEDVFKIYLKHLIDNIKHRPKLHIFGMDIDNNYYYLGVLHNLHKFIR